MLAKRAMRSCHLDRAHQKEMEPAIRWVAK